MQLLIFVFYFAHGILEFWQMIGDQSMIVIGKTFFWVALPLHVYVDFRGLVVEQETLEMS